jgi:hypothetical protein
MLHIHSPLKPRDESGVDASKYEFIGAICPGNPYGNGNFDFKGCGTDARQERVFRTKMKCSVQKKFPTGCLSTHQSTRKFRFSG